MNYLKIERRLKQLKTASLFYLVKTWSLFYRKKFDCWLISERGKDARDNGYVFYKYLKREHPDVPVKYVISDDSPDRARIDDCDVIKYGSWKHYYYYIMSPMLLSTHYQGYSPNLELFSQLDRRGLIHVRGKKVLLDHCVRMAKAGCTRDTVRIDKMICSIPKEYKALSQNAGYESGVLCNMGMPRFDNLYETSSEVRKRQILFMPTWRMKYTNSSEKEFMEGEYYLACKKLIESDELAAFLEAEKFDFVFYPHIEMQKFINLFTNKSERIKIREAGSAIVEDLLIESQVLITDYSSVFFDFVYMYKPVIYYHFDNDENQAMIPKRWFDFDRDGFGPICYSADELISTLKNMELSRLDDKYINRVNDTFPVRDKRNCARVFDMLWEIIKNEN